MTAVPAAARSSSLSLCGDSVSGMGAAGRVAPPPVAGNRRTDPPWGERWPDQAMTGPPRRPTFAPSSTNETQGGHTMANIQRKSHEQPDETRPVDKGKVEVVNVDGTTMMRTTFEPGWRWAECVKPIVGGESCQVNHVGYCISGRLHVRVGEGEELGIGSVSAMRVPPAQDAWVVGDEPYVGVDFVGAEGYAKP